MLWVGRIASKPIHSYLLYPPAEERGNDAQTLVLNVILDKFLTSLDLIAYL